MSKPIIGLCLVFLAQATLVHGAATQSLVLPSFLSDNMVLQRNGAVVWGWINSTNGVSDAATTMIDVQVYSGTQLVTQGTTTVSSSTAMEAWSIALSVQTPLSNSSVVIKATSSSGTLTKRLTNVAWGDVYLCSGQSNMEYPVADAFYGAAEREQSDHPNLRLLNFADIPQKSPATDCKTKTSYIWAPSSAATLSARGANISFGSAFPSAVCYFSARDILLANPTVPIGIITAAKSGSPIESWMPAEALRDGTPPMFGGNGSCGGSTTPVNRPANPPATQKCSTEITGDYYYGMIAPLTPMRLTAVLWYQGEENDHADDACPGPQWYRCLFPAMISYWRREFKLADLPFFYVLLAAGHTAVMREAQAQGAGAINHTAFASAVDLGAAESEYLIPGHPPRKQEVGRRVSLLARALIYGDTSIDYLGPTVIVEKVTVTQATVTTVTIPFNVGTNGFLHLNGTGGCTLCCNMSAGISPVSLLDPDAVEAVVTRTTSFSVDSASGTLTASVAQFKSSKGRVQVQFLFDNAPECALYNGENSGPDSVYAADPHLGLVAQTWRGNLTISSNRNEMK